MELERVVYKLEADITDLKRAYGVLQQENEKTNRSFTALAGNMTRGMSSSLMALQAGFAGLGLGLTAGEVLKLSDAWRMLGAQMRIGGTDAAAVSGVIQALYTDAQRLGVSVQGSTDLFMRLGKSTKSLKLDQSQLLELTKTLNLAVAVSGASAEDAAGGLYQLGQAFQRGKLGGDELVAISERLPKIMEVLRAHAEKLGTTLETIQNKGGITNKFIVEAFAGARAGLEKELDEIPQTVDKAMQRVRNSWFMTIGQMIDKDMFQPVIDQINELANVFATPGFQQGVAKITGDIVGLIKYAAENLEALAAIGKIGAGAVVGGKIAGAPGAAFGAIVGAESGLAPLFDRNKAKLDLENSEFMIRNYEAAIAVLEKVGSSHETLDRKLKETQATYDQITAKLVDAQMGTQNYTEANEIAANVMTTVAAASGVAASGIAAVGAQAEMTAEELARLKEQQSDFFKSAAQGAADAQARLAAFKRSGEEGLKNEQNRQKITGSLEKLKIDPNSEEGEKAQADLAAADAAEARLEKAREAGRKATAEAEARIATSKREKEAREEYVKTQERELETANLLAAAAEEGSEVYEQTKTRLATENRLRELKIDIMSKEGQQILANAEIVRQAEKEAERTRQNEGVEKGLVKREERANALGATLAGFMAERGGMRSQIASGGRGGQSPAELSRELQTSLEEMKKFETEAEAVRQTLDALADGTLPEVQDALVAQTTATVTAEEALRQLKNAFDEYLEITNDNVAADRELVALRTGGLKAHAAEQAAIERENRIKALGIDISSKTGQFLLKEAAARDANQTAVEKEAAALQKKQDARVDFGDMILDPFENMLDDMRDMTAQAFNDILKDGKVKWAELNEGLNESMRGGVAQLGADLLHSPMKGAMDKFRTSMEQSMANGGNVITGAKDFATKNPAAAGAMMGTVGGTIGGAIGGKIAGNDGNNYAGIGTSAGTLVGGAIGSIWGPVGTMVGSALGGTIGGIFGGLIGAGGDGENNDAQGYLYNPLDQSFQKTDRKGSSENTQAAMQLAKETQAAARMLRASGLEYSGKRLGFKVGNNTGVTFEDESFDTSGEALKAAIKLLIERSAGIIPETLRTVLNNTRAESSSELAKDIQVAKEYDKLVNDTSQYKTELEQLRETFANARFSAQELGLDINKLSLAEQRASEELRKATQRRLEDGVRGGREQLVGFMEGITNPLRDALGAYGADGNATAPGQQLQAGLAEFREILALARADDVTALGKLPGAGQQLQALAETLGASGQISSDVMREVRAGLAEVLAVQQGRQEAILQAIPDTIRFTAAQQIAVLREGFDKMVAELAQFRRESRLGSGL